MQQILIIGLGLFGRSLAKSLHEKGAEVLAVDRRRDLVEEATAFTTQTLTMDATDEAALAALNPQDRDTCVCALGDDSREHSIICTALLRQMGAKHIVARSSNALQKRILRLVGAHQVLNPEEEFGSRFASQLAYQNVISNLSLGNDLQLTELQIPSGFVGKSLIELSLPKRFGVVVVAIRRGSPPEVQQPDPSEPLHEKDSLVVVSTETALPKLIKES